MNDWKNTVKRAVKTFVQAALGYIVAALGGGIAGLYDADGKISRVALGGLVVSAVAAGLAALMNLPERAPDVEGIYGARETARKYVENVDESDKIAAELAATYEDAEEGGADDGETV